MNIAHWLCLSFQSETQSPSSIPKCPDHAVLDETGDSRSVWVEDPKLIVADDMNGGQ